MARISVLVNGTCRTPTGFFHNSRGLRQGNLLTLSFCEALNKVNFRAVYEGFLYGCRMNRRIAKGIHFYHLLMMLVFLSSVKPIKIS